MDITLVEDSNEKKVGDYASTTFSRSLALSAWPLVALSLLLILLLLNLVLRMNS